MEKSRINVWKSYKDVGSDCENYNHSIKWPVFDLQLGLEQS